MLKRAITNWSLVLSALFATILSTAISAACICAAAAHHQAQTDHDLGHQIKPSHKNHCPPSASHQSTQDAHQADAANCCENRIIEGNCGCCIKKAPATLAALEKKNVSIPDFDWAITAPQLVFAWQQVVPIQFPILNVAYYARSDTSDKPARAPPCL